MRENPIRPILVVPHAAAAGGADDRTWMARDLEALAGRTHDVVIVGGGISGACVAWDAVLRGLTVVLLEQGDFGEATSANSQKIVHGGFRYLQHGDVRRMRHSIGERRILLRVAPHLVHPLPVLLPTLRRGLQRRGIMGAALALYDLIAWDRNRGLRDPQQRIPPSRLISRDECVARIPGLPGEGIIGGAVWYDGRIEHPERLTLAFLRSAAARGAAAANYAQVTGFLRDGRRVQGVRVLDRLTGRTLDVRGRLVINTSGPWVNRVLGLTTERLRIPLAFSKTISLVLARALTNGDAVSLPTSDGRRLFFVPWRGGTLAGSSHRLAEQDGAVQAVTDDELDELLREINAVYPDAGVRRGDVTAILAGLLPLEPRGGQEDPALLTGRYQIRDHGREDGVPGLLSVVSVKYTTARRVAEEAVTRALRLLGRRVVPSRSAMEPLWGGAIARRDAFLDGAAHAGSHGLDAETMRRLAEIYGSAYGEVLRWIDAEGRLARCLSPRTPVLGAEVIHAVREEMAQTLADVVLRRTTLGTFGHPGREALEVAASLMAEALCWDAGRTRQELEAVEAALAARGARPSRESVR